MEYGTHERTNGEKMESMLEWLVLQSVQVNQQIQSQAVLDTEEVTYG